MRYEKHVYEKDNVMLSVEGLSTGFVKVAGDKLYHVFISRLPGEADDPDPRYRLAIVGEDERGEWGAIYVGNRAEVMRLVEHHTGTDGGNLGRWEMYATVPQLAEQLPWSPWAPNMADLVDALEYVDVDPDNYVIPHREPESCFFGYAVWAAAQGWGAEDRVKQRHDAKQLVKSLTVLY